MMSENDRNIAIQMLNQAGAQKGVQPFTQQSRDQQLAAQEAAAMGEPPPQAAPLPPTVLGGPAEQPKSIGMMKKLADLLRGASK
jgi:hypothetical protein